MPLGDRLEKIIINRQYRKQFTIELSHYGVNKLSLFPDLDGLSRHVNWSYLNLKEQDKEAEWASLSQNKKKSIWFSSKKRRGIVC